MTSAPAIGQRLTRLLLLVVTALGVAALHTVGHASIVESAHHPVLRATTAVVVAAPIPGDRDGCDGDGCTHLAAVPANSHTSRWWEACIAVLSVLALGALAWRPRRRIRGAVEAAPRRPPPSRKAARSLGLALATGTVLRT